MIKNSSSNSSSSSRGSDSKTKDNDNVIILDNSSDEDSENESSSNSNTRSNSKSDKDNSRLLTGKKEKNNSSSSINISGKMTNSNNSDNSNRSNNDKKQIRKSGSNFLNKQNNKKENIVKTEIKNQKQSFKSNTKSDFELESKGNNMNTRTNRDRGDTEATSYHLIGRRLVQAYTLIPGHVLRSKGVNLEFENSKTKHEKDKKILTANEQSSNLFYENAHDKNGMKKKKKEKFSGSQIMFHTFDSYDNNKGNNKKEDNVYGRLPNIVCDFLVPLLKAELIVVKGHIGTVGKRWWHVHVLYC